MGADVLGATASGQDSAVHLHLKEKGHSLKDTEVHVLDKEDRWFERSEGSHLCPLGTANFAQRRGVAS